MKTIQSTQLVERQDPDFGYQDIGSNPTIIIQDLPRSERELISLYKLAGIHTMLETLRIRVNLICDKLGIEYRKPTLEPLQPEPERLPAHVTDKMTMPQIERFVLERRLRHKKGNRTATAESLGLTVRTVRNLIREHGIEG